MSSNEVRLGWLGTVPRALALLFALTTAGCGLTLDYSPPDDAGTGLDAPFDANVPDGSHLCPVACEDDEICVAGVCRATCAQTSDCHDDDVCEQCVGGVCKPAPDDACGIIDGCFQTTCDPTTDLCDSPFDICVDEGLACIDGSCGEVTCSGTDECADITNPLGCAFVCDPDTLTCRSPTPCARPAGDCRRFDPCTCIAEEVPDDSLCTGDVALCDPTTFRCVECVGDDDCSDDESCDSVRHVCVGCRGNGDCAVGQVCEATAGDCVECVVSGDCSSGVCDPFEHVCVGCVGNADCGSGRPFCDLGRGECVECATSLDCPADEPLCDPTSGNCTGCGSDSDCGMGACVAGVCTTAMCSDGACPEFDCTTGVFCSSGACTYDVVDELCDDHIPCTEDRCDPTRAVDHTGCVHVAGEARTCEDGLSCTDGICDPSRGCVQVPHDDRCRTGGTLGCAISLCVAGEPDARFDSSTGCGLTYVACPVGQYCTNAGACLPAPACNAGMPCPEDGNPCNGTLACIGAAGVGTCVPVDLGVDACLGASTCGTYCSTSGCERRSESGGPCVIAVDTMPTMP